MVNLMYVNFTMLSNGSWGPNAAQYCVNTLLKMELAGISGVCLYEERGQCRLVTVSSHSDTSSVAELDVKSDDPGRYSSWTLAPYRISKP